MERKKAKMISKVLEKVTGLLLKYKNRRITG
jgi:hypothetical protein